MAQQKSRVLVRGALMESILIVLNFRWLVTKIVGENDTVNQIKQYSHYNLTQISVNFVQKVSVFSEYYELWGLWNPSDRELCHAHDSRGDSGGDGALHNVPPGLREGKQLQLGAET